MRLVVRHHSLISLLHWTQRSLLIGGVVTLGYYGYVMIDVSAFQRESSEQFSRQNTTVQPPANQPVNYVSGDLIGRIEIGRLGVSVVVVEGTGSAVLRRAVGHIPGTALPGHQGNVAISGHRDTYFRRPGRRVDQVLTLVTCYPFYFIGSAPNRLIVRAERVS